MSLYLFIKYIIFNVFIINVINNNITLITFVFVFFEVVQEDCSKTEITFHELFGILWTVDACKVENEVTFLAPQVKLFKRGVEVILKDFIDDQISIVLSLILLS